MPVSKSIILTGASKGMGLAVAKYLLRESHKLTLVARSAGPLQKLKEEYPDQVEYVAGDLADFSIGPKVVEAALKAFSQIDGLIINHGVITPVKRIADFTPEEWRTVFDINFISAIALIKPALPALRKSQGRIILISSGAAVGAYAGWGAYGSSKAAMNHLSLTLSAEEPDITSVAIRPGIMDTDMQKEIRGHSHVMDARDSAKFKDLHESGQSLKPERPGGVIARLALTAEKELSGKFVSWDDKTLEKYRDS